MVIDSEKFKRFRESGREPVQSLLAIPITQENQKDAAILRNRNPIIKDEITEILDMKEGGYENLSPEQKAYLRRQAAAENPFVRK